MKRALLAAGLTAVLGASALVAVPAATAANCYTNWPSSGTAPCADPTSVSVSAPTTVITSYSATVPVSAVFADASNTIRDVTITVRRPDGGSSTVWANPVSKNAAGHRTFRGNYYASASYAPGRYAATAVPSRDSRVVSGTFPSSLRASGTFVIKHKVSTSMTLAGGSARIKAGKKNRLTGQIRGTTALSGLKVTVQMKAKGKKKFKKVGATVKAKSTGVWTSKKYRMPSGSRWRVKVASKTYVVGTTTASAKVSRRYF